MSYELRKVPDAMWLKPVKRALVDQVTTQAHRPKQCIDQRKLTHSNMSHDGIDRALNVW